MSPAITLHQEQQRFNRLLTDLHLSLPIDRVDLADALLSYAEEFGIEATTARMTANPEHFGLSPELGTNVLVKLAELHQLARAIDVMISEREDQLCAADPQRSRRYAFGDREFTIDRTDGSMTFTHTNERHSIPSELKAVPTRSRPRHRDRNRGP